MAFMYTPFHQLGPPWDIPAAPPLIPQAILALPFALYGISYDFNFHHMEDSPPDGWGVPRSHVYNQLTTFFLAHGYIRSQYSMWVKFSWPVYVWQDMMDLRDITPQGIFATCIQRLCMVQIPLPIEQYWLIYDIQLGGLFSLHLYGPTPANRIPMGVVNNPVPNNWPNNQGNHLPPAVRHSHGAYQSVHWCVA
ncbi:hypothetical protein BJ165DRAFT_761474 [Panaeolus papilionaceus]|nr:hypothetical protein BJ165DRAFT_761474 [Panaeolus papilionaceus]